MGMGLGKRAVIMGVGAVAKLVSSYANTTSVLNSETLLRLIRSRPGGVGLVTVSNHMSTLDDPLLWGFKGFPSCDARVARWVLAAEDICFTNPAYSLFFRLGNCIPITRGGGVYQPYMDQALHKLSQAQWLHTFPQGAVSQEEHAPIARLKWGTASLIARSPLTPIVLPIIHHGFHKVMPENYLFGRRRPLVPLWNKKITIIVGDPIDFQDLPAMKENAISMSRSIIPPSLLGWPLTPDGLDEPAQRCLYSAISLRIQLAMENLRILISTPTNNQNLHL